MSEVSFDDAPSSRLILAVTRVTVPLLPSSMKAGVSSCMTADALASVKATAPIGLSQSSMPYPYPGTDPRTKVCVGGGGSGGGGAGRGRGVDRGAGGGGGGGGGGLLDDTRSSAVSSMLLSAKQKQSNVSDGSDDDWDQ